MSCSTFRSRLSTTCRGARQSRRPAWRQPGVLHGVFDVGRLQPEGGDGGPNQAAVPANQLIPSRRVTLARARHRPASRRIIADTRCPKPSNSATSSCWAPTGVAECGARHTAPLSARPGGSPREGRPEQSTAGTTRGRTRTRRQPAADSAKTRQYVGLLLRGVPLDGRHASATTVKSAQCRSRRRRAGPSPWRGPSWALLGCRCPRPRRPRYPRGARAARDPSRPVWGVLSSW